MALSNLGPKSAFEWCFFKDNEGREVRVVTSLLHLSAEEIAGMYKARCAIETFFRWIKQNLNVPVLFGTTENSVFNQLFSALIAYVLLHWLYKQTKSSISQTNLSLVAFDRLVTLAVVGSAGLISVSLF
nr:transposase [Bacillus xiapuensis]